MIAIISLSNLIIQNKVTANHQIPHISQGYTNLSVKDFGAVGDGVTDDLNAINKALSRCSSSQILFFPSGKYLLGKNLIINKPVIISGQNASLIGDGGFFLTAKAENTSIKNLTFVGLNISARCGNVTIKGNTFRMVKANAIAFLVDSSQNNYNITIDNNKFRDIYPSTDSRYNSSGRAFYITSNGKCNNLSVTNNMCSKIYGGSALFLKGNFSNFKVDKNIIDSISGQGIELFQINENSTGEVNNNQISNCGILRTNKSGVGCNGIYASTINANQGMTGISVCYNQITNVYENGIEGNFNLIKGNKITNTGIDLVNHPTPSPEGIFNGLNIIENTITNPGGHGIYLFSNNGVLISDRVISGNIIIQNNRKQGFSGIAINTRDRNQLTQKIQLINNTISNFESSIYLPYGKNVKNVSIQSNSINKCDRFIMNEPGGVKLLGNVLKGDKN